MIFRGAKTGKNRVEATFYLPNTSISGKECGAILGGGHGKNIISKEAVEKFKFPVEKHHTPYKVALFRKGNEVTVTSRCLVSICDGVDDEAHK